MIGSVILEICLLTCTLTDTVDQQFSPSAYVKEGHINVAVELTVLGF